MSARDDVIERQVVSVLRERFSVPDSKLGPEHWDEPLTGSLFGFSGVDVTYLFFELERTFNARFGEQDLVGYGFSTINKIAEAVRRQAAVAAASGLTSRCEP